MTPGRNDGGRLRYVHRFVDRHGRVRHYFRLNGRRTALPGAPGSREFMEAYSKLLPPETPPRGRPKGVLPRSVRDLVVRYYRSPGFLALKPVTQGNYRRILDRFCEAHGNKAVAGMSRAALMRIVGEMADRPGAAIVLMKRLKTVVGFALDLGWIAVDPTHRLRTYASAEIHTWTEEEVAAFERRWPIGSKQRLAFALHLYTGQRRSDVYRMAWDDYTGEAMRVVQQKTGAKLTVATHPELRAILQATPRKGVSILVTDWGKAFTVAGYGNWLRDAIREAGLPKRCVLHGLRKVTARRLAEAGCTPHEIMAMTGHQCLSEVERYTRAANQVALSRKAVEKQSLALGGERAASRWT